MKTVAKVLFGLMCGILLLSFLAGCGGGGGGDPAVLVSLEVAPAQPTVALGTAAQFTATGVFSDHTRKDLTSLVTWSSANGNATISNTAGSKGLATAVAAGSTTITATLGGITGSTTVTVTAATLQSIGVTPTNPSIALGTTRQFTAVGTFNDGTTQDLTTQVTWSSSNGNATISNTAGSNGLATAVAAGSATITATLGGVTGSTTLTVTPATLSSVEVSPANPTIASGTTLQFKATGIFSDGTKQDLTTSAAWSSSTSAATITGGGLATGVSVGTPIITASFGGKSGASTLTVTAVTLVTIEVAPLNPSIARGTSQQFMAIGTYTNNTKQDLTAAVTWTSDTPATATISNAAGSNGLATSVAAGTTTIAAALGGVSGHTLLTVTNAALLSIDVEPSTPTLPAGVTQQFTATGAFDNGTTQDLTTQVTWRSTPPTVATISNAPGSKGVALTVASGTTNITASFGTVTGSTQLTVNTDPLLSIQITPPDPRIPQSLTQQFTATGIYANSPSVDLTAAVTWSSSDNTVATISNDPGSAGLATPVKPGGPITITATIAGISPVSTTLTVTSATLVSIAVTPVNPSIAKLTTQQFKAIGTYSDASTYDITQFVSWTSTAPAVATISNEVNSQGLATGVGVGSTTISAALGSVVSNNATLTVTNAVLQSITITPAPATIAVKTSLQFTATGNFNNGTTQDLTRLSTWSSSNTNIAAISNAAKSQGVATGVSINSSPVTITATFAGISGTASLTVATATLDSITITPATASVAVGSTQQFQAIASYNGGAFTQNLTNAVVWSSDTTSVAVTSNGFYTRGLVTAVGAGTATISARKPSNTVPIVSATITVTP